MPSWRACATRTRVVRGIASRASRRIAPYTIEEAYEVADAIARSDLDGLKDELGDLLLQVVYHARMALRKTDASASPTWSMPSRAKMIRRHPHVFADPKSQRCVSLVSVRLGADQGRGEGWRGGSGERRASRLDDVPLALPALTRAVKLQKRAAQVGFDWPSLAPVLAKAEEEIAELKAAIADDQAR